jgi:shikimate kinase
MDPETNIVLIGMPGAGKSTLGVLLAKELSRSFLDTDIYIQTREGRALQTILEEQGIDRFLEVEESHVLSLKLKGHVIATGGSVVYSPKALAHLKRKGIAVWLELSLPLLVERIRDMDSRGIAMAPGQDLESLYHERKPLYDRHADIRISCDHKGHEAVLREIASRLASYSPKEGGGA